MLCTLETPVYQLQSLSAWRTEVWACAERELYLLPSPVIFPAPFFSFAGHLLGRLHFGGEKFFDRRIRCIGRKCGSRCVVEQDIHVNFWVNFTWFSLCRFVCPLTETCSFWCGLKDLLTSSCTSYWQSCPWPLKLMTTHGILHRMWWLWAVQERMG